jgi:hypothetical protein
VRVWLQVNEDNEGEMELCDGAGNARLRLIFDTEGDIRLFGPQREDLWSLPKED